MSGFSTENTHNSTSTCWNIYDKATDRRATQGNLTYIATEMLLTFCEWLGSPL